MSEYGIQLREKQKVRRIYGVLESQFRSYYERATRQKGVSGENLLKILESRFDNVVYRLGLAPSRNAARQLILHRHFTVNGKVVNIPSYLLRPGDIVAVREKSRKKEIFHESMKRITEDNMLPWLRLDKAKMSGEFMDSPSRQDIPINVQENLIIELYSK
ncbi:MAG: 30S ribosomal protein S4 [Calditrichia bacterium]